MTTNVFQMNEIKSLKKYFNEVGFYKAFDYLEGKNQMQILFDYNLHHWSNLTTSELAERIKLMLKCPVCRSLMKVINIADQKVLVCKKCNKNFVIN